MNTFIKNIIKILPLIPSNGHILLGRHEYSTKDANDADQLLDYSSPS